MSHPDAACSANGAPTQTKTPRVTITCGFCHGKGKDPFAIMSELSTCGCCGGRGTVRVAVNHVKCAFCKGSGSHKTYRCPVCGGAGALAEFPQPCQNCPDCGGKAFESSSGLPCLTCRGRGLVAE